MKYSMQYVIIPIEIGATGIIIFTSLPHQCQYTENAVTPRTYTALPSACKAQEKQHLTFHKVVFPNRQQTQQTEFCNLD